MGIPEAIVVLLMALPILGIVYVVRTILRNLQPNIGVAAHLGDLRAAKGLGLRTAFVPRPLEYGQSRTPDLTPDSSVEVAARDFMDLARQLGA